MKITIEIDIPEDIALKSERLQELYAISFEDLNVKEFDEMDVLHQELTEFIASNQDVLMVALLNKKYVENTEVTEEHIQKLFDKMIEDYARTWLSNPTIDDERMAFRQEMCKQYKENLHFDVLQKYIRIVRDDTAAGFIVNTKSDKKYPLGTLLYAKSWHTPSRNHARGNIFEVEKAKIRWTGVPTLI